MESDLSDHQNPLSYNMTLACLRDLRADAELLPTGTKQTLDSALWWLENPVSAHLDGGPSPQASAPAPATEPSTLTTLQIAVPNSAHFVKVEVSKGGSCVSVSWPSVLMER